MQKLFNEKMKPFLIRNKWTLLASGIFVLWSFFLIHTLWNERLSPPEPDDSYIYITHIESVRNCPSIFFCAEPIYSLKGFGFYSHFTYRIIFGYLSLALNIDSVDAYHVSFYVGSFLLLLVLVTFLRSLGANDKLTAICLIFLMSYGGGGTMQNFSWVIPQLFSLMLFLLLISVILKAERFWRIPIVLLIVFGILMHTISIYYFFILVIFITLYFIFRRKTDWFIAKKTAFAICIAILSYSSLSFYLSKVANGHPYGIENFSAQSLASIKATTNEIKQSPTPSPNTSTSASKTNVPKYHQLFPGFEKIKNNYLKWVFLNPVGIICFFIISFILIYYKKHLILSLYIAAFLFTILSSVNKFGPRSLSFLVPVTFIFYAYGFYYLFRYFSDKEIFSLSKKLLKSILACAIIVFLAINMLFSYFWNSYVNERNNYLLPKEYVSWIIDTLPPKRKIAYDSKILGSFDTLYGLRKISKTKKLSDAYYYIAIEKEPSKFENTPLDNYLNIIAKLFHIKRQENIAQKNTLLFSEKHPEFIRVQQFGDISIYKNSGL